MRAIYDPDGHSAEQNFSAAVVHMPQAGSKLINNGTNQVPMKVEFMPTPYMGAFRRPNDGRMDIGAFEFSDQGGRNFSKE